MRAARPLRAQLLIAVMLAFIAQDHVARWTDDAQYVAALQDARACRIAVSRDTDPLS